MSGVGVSDVWLKGCLVLGCLVLGCLGLGCLVLAEGVAGLE